MIEWTMRGKNKQDQLKQIKRVFKKLEEVRPSLKDVLSQIRNISLVDTEVSFKQVVASGYNMHDWTPSRVKEFFSICPYHKPMNYRVCSLAFSETNSILLNLSQIEETVQEYLNHLNGDAFEKRRNERYFKRDSGYEQYQEYMQTVDEAFNFFFWHELFQQVRLLEQSMRDVDLFEFDYDMENSTERNDMIGFSKAMFQAVVNKKMLETA